jgi:methylmalonyl-CoA mutase cobalamin-binding subunit
MTDDREERIRLIVAALNAAGPERRAEIIERIFASVASMDVWAIAVELGVIPAPAVPS